MMKSDSLQALDKLKRANPEELYVALDEFITVAMDNYSTILRSKLPDLYNEILKSYGSKFSEKAYTFVNRLSEPPRCDCGNYVKWTLAAKYFKGYPKHCSMRCLNKSQEHKDSIRNNNIAKGLPANGFTEETKSIIRKTNLERYGSEYYLASDHCRVATKLTNQRKYGVDNPMQVRSIAERTNGGFKRKLVHIKGKTYNVQGYEPIALRFLLEEFGLKHVEIKTGSKAPTIRYYDDTKLKWRSYFPDIYIPKMNLIIEVKSKWTLNNPVWRTENIMKFNYCIRHGYNFAFMICSDKDPLEFHINGDIQENLFPHLQSIQNTYEECSYELRRNKWHRKERQNAAE